MNSSDVSRSQLLRLESALRLRNQEHSSQRQFIAVAKALARCESFTQLLPLVESEIGLPTAVSFAKSVQAANGYDAAWQSGPGRELADAFLASVAEQSVLELLVRYGRVVPRRLQKVLISSGAWTSATGEGAPKVVKHVDLVPLDLDLTKVAGIVVVSDELEVVTSGSSSKLFEDELRTALLSAVNQTVLAMFVNSTTVATTGTAAGDLAAGLAAAEASSNYIVTALPEVTRELALQSDGRMSVTGGEFVPGVHVVSVAGDTASPRLTVIPTDRVALVDEGLSLRRSTQGTIEMSDTPTNPATASTVMTSLWQNNLIGLLIERSFRLAADGVTVVQVG